MPAPARWTAAGSQSQVTAGALSNQLAVLVVVTVLADMIITIKKK